MFGKKCFDPGLRLSDQGGAAGIEGAEESLIGPFCIRDYWVTSFVPRKVGFAATPGTIRVFLKDEREFE